MADPGSTAAGPPGLALTAVIVWASERELRGLAGEARAAFTNSSRRQRRRDEDTRAFHAALINGDAPHPDGRLKSIAAKVIQIDEGSALTDATLAVASRERWHVQVGVRPR